MYINPIYILVDKLEVTLLLQLRCYCNFAALALVSRYTNFDWLHVFAKVKSRVYFEESSVLLYWLTCPAVLEGSRVGLGTLIKR